MSGLVVACGRPRPGPVTPAEIPALKANAAQQPRNAQIQFRLAAALMAAGQCDTAVVVTKSGPILAPRAALGAIGIRLSQRKDRHLRPRHCDHIVLTEPHPASPD